MPCPLDGEDPECGAREAQIASPFMRAISEVVDGAVEDRTRGTVDKITGGAQEPTPTGGKCGRSCHNNFWRPRVDTRGDRSS